MEDGFVFAAANETIVVMPALFCAERKEHPPPIECPIIAVLGPTLGDGTSTPAPLL